MIAGDKWSFAKSALHWTRISRVSSAGDKRLAGFIAVRSKLGGFELPLHYHLMLSLNPGPCSTSAVQRRLPATPKAW